MSRRKKPSKNCIYIYWSGFFCHLLAIRYVTLSTLSMGGLSGTALSTLSTGGLYATAPSVLPTQVWTKSKEADRSQDPQYSMAGEGPLWSLNKTPSRRSTVLVETREAKIAGKGSEYVQTEEGEDI